MKLPHHQRGLGALSLLIIVVVAAFFGTCVIKLAPVYMEYKTVEKAVKSVVDEATAGSIPAAQIRSKLSKLFTVNMIDALDLKDVKVTQDKGRYTLDARYERRLPLMLNIDVVVKFDQLLFEFTPVRKN